MYVILMDEQKQLVTTYKKPIYRGENLVDVIKFLLPQSYCGMDLSDFKVTLQYIKFGVVNQEEELCLIDDPDFETKLCYTISIDSNFTKSWGKKEIQLKISKVDVDSETQQIMKTSPCIIWVFPSATVSIDEDNEEETTFKIEKLESDISIIKEILKTKGEDIVLDSKTGEIFLSVDGIKVGTGVTADDMGNAIAEHTADGTIKVIT